MGAIKHPHREVSWNLAMPKKKAHLVVTDEYVTMYHLEHEAMLAARGNPVPLFTVMAKLAASREDIETTLAVLSDSTEVALTDVGIEFTN